MKSKLKLKSKYQVSKDKCRKTFSEYIRKRDTDKLWLWYCITCHVQSILVWIPLKKIMWNRADAWHFISRWWIALFIDEKNVHLQCRECNQKNEGEKYRYWKAIDIKYWQWTADELCRRKLDRRRYSAEYRIKMEWKYREKINILDKHKSTKNNPATLEMFKINFDL